MADRRRVIVVVREGVHREGRGERLAIEAAGDQGVVRARPCLPSALACPCEGGLSACLPAGQGSVPCRLCCRGLRDRRIGRAEAVM